MRVIRSTIAAKEVGYGGGGSFSARPVFETGAAAVFETEVETGSVVVEEEAGIVIELVCEASQVEYVVGSIWGRLYFLIKTMRF